LGRANESKRIVKKHTHIIFPKFWKIIYYIILYAKIHSIKLITYSPAFHWATAQPVIGPSQMRKVQPSLSLGLPKSGRYSFGNAWKILNGPKIINTLGTKQHNTTSQKLACLPNLPS